MEEEIILPINISGLNGDAVLDAKAGDFVALSGIKKALEKVGFDITELDLNCMVNLSIGSPEVHTLIPNAYNIFYSAIESELNQDAVDSLNRANEVWTPSDFGFDILTKQLTVPVYKVSYGMSGYFMPTKRKTDDVFTFLSIYEDNEKHHINNVIQAFTEQFGDREDVRLIIKTRSKLESTDTVQNNIKVIDEILYQDDYLRLLQTSNCLIYTSDSESFGFIPLEAIATGMPVISTHNWCEYKDLIEYKLENTSVESISTLINLAYENKENDADFCFYKSFKAHREWQWNEKFIKEAAIRLKFAHQNSNNKELNNARV